MTASETIDIVSILVTFLSVLYAAYERKQSKSAKQEARELRELLLKQQLAQQFANTPRRAMRLFRYVGSKNWQDSGALALLLTADLASLSGAGFNLISATNKRHVERALAELAEFHRCVRLDGTVPSPEMESKLVETCNVILVTVTAIERSLHLAAALGGDPNGL